MSRTFLALVFCAILSAVNSAAAQDLHAIARIDPAESSISDRLLGGVSVKLRLSQPVPYRVFTLNDPKRLVIDFKEVDWSGFPAADILNTKAVQTVRFGIFRPGWSRMVLELVHPMTVEIVEMDTKGSGLSATLDIRLKNASHTEFFEKVGAPDDPDWTLASIQPAPVSPARQTGDRPLMIALDPGHGGIDPGAERQDHKEKQLVLLFARELKEALILSGRYTADMTRSEDEFVSLPERITRARALGADVFISLHADALESGNASGTTVYTLSAKASDEAGDFLAAQHDRSDLLAGVDLSHQDDQIATVLMDLARVETDARSDALAELVVDGIAGSVGHLRKRAHLSAGFTVLKAPDIPSILVELGFMSSKNDLNNLLDKDWRAKVIAGIISALDEWAIQDAAQAQLLRK